MYQKLKKTGRKNQDVASVTGRITLEADPLAGSIQEIARYALDFITMGLNNEGAQAHFFLIHHHAPKSFFCTHF